MNEQEIFAEALEQDASRRAAFLDEACGIDTELRRRIDYLLKCHDRAGAFIDKPAGEILATAEMPAIAEKSGTNIGPYKLLEPIGEGGMGTVWMAQQTAPIKRLVAVKLIKAGMDSAQVIARFEAERQALALMDHPNIARVLDGGTTSAGLPYFVMDLVKGMTITRYCDEHRLTPRQRLELFIPVCQAVQHAHQKGIIHRDLKPSNVLVALYDGKPVPKVIDFGVAKAAGQPLTDRTLVTGFGNFVGTLEYMSPEQAEINQLDIDTRSDIYSLGVLLYELLAGSTPFSRKDLEKAGMLEMLRVIREDEPSKPSTKLSSSDALPTLSANRGTEPAKLTRQVRGELDWIVMKCLEKDRNRRYETANGFAMDVQRYLADEPVLACPPSAGYRLRKFARRNKRELATAAMVTLAILVAVGTLGWAMRDRAARTREVELEQMARAAEQANHLERAVERGELLQREGKRGEALAAFERAQLLARESEPLSPLRKRIDLLQGLLDAEGKDLDFVARFEAIRREDQTEVDAEKNIFNSEKGYPKLREALKQNGIEVAVTPPTDAVARIQGRPPAVQKLVFTALDECLQFVSSEDAIGRQWLLEVLEKADGDPWRKEVRKAWRNVSELKRLVKDVNVSRHPANFLVMTIKALPAKSSSRLDLALRVQRAYPDDFWANHRLGTDLRTSGKPLEAIHYHTAALALQPRNPGTYLNRSLAFEASANLAQGLADINQAIDLAPRYAIAWRIKGRLLQKMNDMENAAAALRQALVLNPKDGYAHALLTGRLQPGSHPDVEVVLRETVALNRKDVEAHYELGRFLFGKQDWNGAITAFREIIALAPTRSLGHTWLGNSLWSKEDFEGAAAAYTEALRLQPDDADANYPLAILLALSPGRKSRDRKRAVELAEKAVERRPKEANYWATLGLARYQAGDWNGAIAAAEHSLKLRPLDVPTRKWDGDADLARTFNLFVFAMARWRLDDKDQARKRYDQAIRWMEKTKMNDPILRLLRNQAAELLGANKKKD